MPHDSELYTIDRRDSGPGYIDTENITFEYPTRRTHRFSLQLHDKEIQRRERAMAKSDASGSDTKRFQQEIAVNNWSPNLYISEQIGIDKRMFCRAYITYAKSLLVMSTPSIGRERETLVKRQSPTLKKGGMLAPS